MSFIRVPAMCIMSTKNPIATLALLIIILSAVSTVFGASNIDPFGACNYIKPVTEGNFSGITFEVNFAYAPNACMSASVASVGSVSYMYSCAADGNSFSLLFYGEEDCGGASTSVTSYDSAYTGYEFECGKDDCYLSFDMASWSGNGKCQGEPILDLSMPLLAGFCTSISYSSAATSTESGISYVYGCTDNSITVVLYLVPDCEAGEESTGYVYKTGCTDTSVKYGGTKISSSTRVRVGNCDNPGFYGLAQKYVLANDLSKATSARVSWLWMNALVILHIVVMAAGVFL